MLVAIKFIYLSHMEVLVLINLFVLGSIIFGISVLFFYLSVPSEKHHKRLLRRYYQESGYAHEQYFNVSKLNDTDFYHLTRAILNNGDQYELKEESKTYQVANYEVVIKKKILLVQFMEYERGRVIKFKK